MLFGKRTTACVDSHWLVYVRQPNDSFGRFGYITQITTDNWGASACKKTVGNLSGIPIAHTRFRVDRRNSIYLFVQGTEQDILKLRYEGPTHDI